MNGEGSGLMERLDRKKVHTNLPVLLVGASIPVLAAGHLATRQPDAFVLLVVAFLILASTVDTLSQRIPNLITVSTMVIGLGIGVLKGGAMGAAWALAGLFFGGGILLPFFLAGVVGAGDVKALAALGALLGPGSLLQVALWGGLIGGGVALFYLVTGWVYSPWKVKFFPYAPVIALGVLACWTWGGFFAF